MTPPYIRPVQPGHNRFITPLASDRRPPVGRDTRARHNFTKEQTNDHHSNR